MNSKEKIEDIFQTLLEVQAHYKIWNKLKEHQSQQNSVDKMKNYSEFFLMTKQAHFISYVVGLYKLFETRRDTINIPQLTKSLKQENQLTNNNLDKLEKLMNEIKTTLWTKISLLRNNAIGHSSKKMTFAEIYQKANITQVEVESLIDKTIQLINKITESLYSQTNCLLSDASQDTDKLINDLKL